MKTREIIESNLPLLTDGGLETHLIYYEGIDLPHFAAFDLLAKPQHKHLLTAYYREYLKVAARYKTGFILESPTWRANTDWGFKMGYSQNDLDAVNKRAIAELKELQGEYRDSIMPLLVSGCLGPRHDGYFIKERMTTQQAMEYHQPQVHAFSEAGADLCTALTMNYAEESLGIVKAAQNHGLPVVISFTVETNGKLPNGESLENAISTIDSATNAYPLYYMINCAHPTHFIDVLQESGEWKNRIRGLRANASCKTHAELDASTELDRGNASQLAEQYTELKACLPNLLVVGGCCGTDAEHVEEIYTKVGPQFEYVQSIPKSELI